MVLAGALFASALAIEGFQSPAAPRRGGNPEAAKLKNPVAATPDSTTAGKRVYQRLCIRCHGPEGKGDGVGAASGGQPSDFTEGKWVFGGSDGDIFTVIHDGTSPDMEGYAARISETDIWNLVNYIRSLSPKGG